VFITNSCDDDLRPNYKKKHRMIILEYDIDLRYVARLTYDIKMSYKVAYCNSLTYDNRKINHTV